jgi:hypothetical protein
MPDPGATESMDLQAHASAQLGPTRQLEQTRCETPHPCRSDRGYDTSFHQEQLAKVAAGKDVNVLESSLCHWRERLDPYCPTGNKAREQVAGVDLINFLTFLKAWPKAHLDEMAIFIYSKGGPLYPITVISKCLDKLKITKKRASTKVYQVQREDIQFRVWSFLELSVPTWYFWCPPMNVD